ALLRPGRFDRIIEVPVPNEKAREAIFLIHSSKMTLDKKVSAEEISSMTEGLTGADIKAICTEAGMLALRENSKKIALKDFSEAVNKVKKKGEEEEKTLHKMFT
ncbi:MAG TPA: proteasome-activating nucleotidase, partial [archaeon]|nr:proteasome-activating nucleotidase [archaeon]